jgi:hypothetical protein
VHGAGKENPKILQARIKMLGLQLLAKKSTKVRDLQAHSDVSPAGSGRICGEQQRLLLLATNKHELKCGSPKGNDDKRSATARLRGLAQPYPQKTAKKIG